MLEVLEFIFQDFFHWFGTLILLAIIFDGIGRMFNINIGTQSKDEEEQI